MPRYFFDIQDNGELTPDDTGMVLLNVEEMRDEAIRTLPAIAADELPDGPQHIIWVRVRDTSGDYVFEASLELKTQWLKRAGSD